MAEPVERRTTHKSLSTDMSLPPNTYFEAADHKAYLTISEEEFLSKVKQTEQYNTRTHSLQNILQPKIATGQDKQKNNSMVVADNSRDKGRVVKIKDHSQIFTRDQARNSHLLSFPSTEDSRLNPRSERISRNNQSRVETDLKAATSDKSALKHNKRISLPSLSMPVVKEQLKEDPRAVNQFMPENISPSIRVKLKLDSIPSHEDAFSMYAAGRKPVNEDTAELQEANETNSSASGNSNEQDLSQPTNQAQVRNETGAPQTIIQRHLEEIAVKKKQFMDEMDELDLELGTYKANYEKLRILRLRNDREKELVKLQMGEVFIEQAAYQLREWRIQKQEAERRRQQLEELRLKQEQDRVREEKEEQIVAELVKVHRDKLENNLIQHLIERIRKQEKRRLRLAEPPPRTPNIVKIEQRLRRQQEEAQELYRRELERQRQARVLHLDKIKQHERLFNEKLKARAQAEKNLVKEVHHAVEFSLKEPFINEEMRQQLRGRKKKQVDYSDRLRERKLSIDESKKEQLQMLIDRDYNPIKYEILRGRGLSDLEIFRLKKDFQLEKNPKKRGDQYLLELRMKHSSLKKLEPVRQEPVKPSTPTPKYINYLTLLPRRKPVDEITSILQKNMSREEKAKLLIGKSEEIQQKVEKEAQTIVPTQEQVDPSGYLKEIQTEKKLDSMFLEMLKVRVEAASLLS